MSLGLYYLPTTRRIELWSQLNVVEQVEEHRGFVEQVINKQCQKLGQSSIWEAITAGTHGIDTLTPSQLQHHLDLGVEYLRRVHHFDYWQLRQYDSIFDLETHSPGYIRTSASSDASAFNHWSSHFHQKLSIVLDPDLFLTQIRQKPISVIVEEKMNAHINQEDETRFRCQVLDCTKLFKDRPFVLKHIEKRHSEWLDEIKAEAGLVHAYLLDPNREPAYKNHYERRNERRRSPVQNRRPQVRYDRPPPKVRMYRDLDAPTEDTPELDY